MKWLFDSYREFHARDKIGVVVILVIGALLLIATVSGVIR